MPNKAPYQLFISNRCNCCDKVVSYLKTHQIPIETVNIDEQKYSLPFSLVILPALIKENKLVGYGYDDIISKLNT